MLNANLLFDGATFFAGTVCLSKTPFITSLQRPFNLSGFALTSATNAFAFAATSQRSEAEKAAALACTTLFLCFIAKPLMQRTTILLNPYAAIQLTAFHALVKVTLYGLYKLAKHFTVSVSFNPTTTEDIKKIAVSQLGTRKAELERSMEEKWDTFNLNMQAAFNVMLVENGQTALPFTNYTRVAPLSEKELQVFQDFVGDHTKNKEQSQVLFDHELPPPSRFDALPDLSPTTVSIPTLSSPQLLWYYQAFSKKLAPEAQVSPFTLAFYHADLLPPTNAFFTPLSIPASADEVSVKQAHYFVNYDLHHPEAFDKQKEKEQAILNEIFVKAGKKPYPLKKFEEPPIENPSWSTAKKVMIYGGCALALIALVVIPTACILMQSATQTSDNPLHQEANKTANVFNDTVAQEDPSMIPLVNQSSVSLPDEQPPLPVYFPFPQEKFKIDLSHLFPKPYEQTPPDRAVSLIYPSLESRYAVCSPDEKPQLPLVPPPLTHETFPQEKFKIDLSHLFPKPYEQTPPDRAVSLIYPSLESRYAVCSPDEKPLPTTIHSLTPINPKTHQPQYVHDVPQLTNHLNHIDRTITNPHSSPRVNQASYSWKHLSLLVAPIIATIAGITKVAVDFFTNATNSFKNKRYLRLIHEHEMRPVCEVDNTLREKDFHNLPRAFEKLSHYTIQTLTDGKEYDNELSDVADNFSEEELDRVAKLVANVTAEKAKVSWGDIDSFSFHFYRLGPNFTSVVACVQLKSAACERLRLPNKFFTDVDYTYPPPSEPKKEPVLFDKSACWTHGNDWKKLPALIDKLSKVSIECNAWKSTRSWELTEETLEQLPYNLNGLLTTKPESSWDEEQPRDSWVSACKVVKALAQEIAQTKLGVAFDEIDFYDLRILKNKSIISFIVTVASGTEKAANACTFFSLKHLRDDALSL